MKQERLASLYCNDSAPIFKAVELQPLLKGGDGFESLGKKKGGGVFLVNTNPHLVMRSWHSVHGVTFEGDDCINMTRCPSRPS